jgi:hypothetical protein
MVERNWLRLQRLRDDLRHEFLKAYSSRRRGDTVGNEDDFEARSSCRVGVTHNKPPSL